MGIDEYDTELHEKHLWRLVMRRGRLKVLPNQLLL